MLGLKGTLVVLAGGILLAFTLGRGVTLETANERRSSIVRVTSVGTVRLASLSPDGTQIGYVRGDGVRESDELCDEGALNDGRYGGCNLNCTRAPSCGDGNLRLVAITGYGQDHDRKRAADSGFDAYLVKPVDIEAMAEQVRKHLSADHAKSSPS